jgi:D-3-phosphoglycerate dehydrogenase / 2-oxoglutarate reductase
MPFETRPEEWIGENAWRKNNNKKTLKTTPLPTKKNTIQGLGRAAVQLVGEGDRGFADVAIEYASPRGDDLDARLLRAMVVKGILEQTTTASVNLVNADLLAKERGLRISEKTVRSDGGDGAPPLTEMSVRLGTGATRFSAALTGGQISVSGTVKAGAPYLTKIGAFDVDLGIEGIFLLTRQIDQPGIIAGVAGILSEGGVNISYMTVCRTGKGEDAIMAVGLDDRPSEELIAKITSIGAISEFALVSED